MLQKQEEHGITDAIKLASNENPIGPSPKAVEAMKLAAESANFYPDGGGYKLAAHHREVVDANWLLVMVNNRECCHCRANHKGLCKLFDPSSFNGATTPAYQALFDRAIERWEALGLEWQEQPFEVRGR